MMRADYIAARHEPDMKTRRRFGSIHDKSVGKSAHAPPRLFRLRHRIHLQPVGIVLVRIGNCKTADAGRKRGLPVPELLAENGGADIKQLAGLARRRLYTG